MLTKSEEEIMNLLWEVGEPLASSEIVSKSVNRTWRKSYINLLINSLLNKQMIEVVGVKQMTKNYARTFQPTMSKYAYSVKRIFSQKGFKEENIPDLFAQIRKILKFLKKCKVSLTKESENLHRIRITVTVTAHN